MTPDEPAPKVTYRRRLIAVMSVAFVGIAGFGFSPKVEHYYQCPLTGRDRIVIARLGVTFSDRVGTNLVSDWAEKNAMTGVVAGQCGWTSISTVTTRLFSSPRFGESMAHMIPHRLHGGTLKLPDLTPEAALRKYQQSIIAAHASNRPLWQVQQEFVEAGDQ